ncbi:MAG TPA: diguanylate cyclase [Burkholderiales bacterium]|nr:diguanylate cyclase [Burkholderiales bacterium]
MPAGSKRTKIRRSSARPRVLAHLSSDWYWEQDAALRFTKVQVQHGEPAEQALAASLLGKRWETGIEIEGGWEPHRALIEARRPFRDVLMWRTLDDGSRRYVRVTGEPVFDAKGRFSGYRGFDRDVTKQRRMQQLLKLDHVVTRRLAEAPSAPEALKGALKAICQNEGWDCAELWKLGDAGVLRRFTYWSKAEDPAARAFIEGSRDLAFQPGVGLVGTVCQSGEPLWLADSTADPRGLRAGLAEHTGLRGAALLPVRSGARVVAVLNFHCRRIRAPDKRLLQALNAISTQIGQFLQHAEAEQAVRDSEARFRSLTNLSSDWFWEQDAEFRFTRLEGRMVAGGDRVLQQRLIGTRRWESGLETEGGWDAHRAQLEARQPFQDLLMWRTMADGAVRYVSVSGEPVFDARGAFAGYRGVGRDITAQKRAEQLLKLEHQVARTLAAAEDAGSGLHAVIRAVCQAEGWACGRYFRLDEGLLRFQYGWSLPDPGFEQFIERSRPLTFRPGQGLLGTALKSGEAVWSQDTQQDPRVYNRELWQGTGLRGGFTFPALAENRVIGVLSFSSPRVREPDQRLLQASRVIGSQIGQFLQRKQAEDSLRESEARFRSLTQMSSDFFWESDAAHRLTQLVHGPNYPAAYMGLGVLGKATWELPSELPDEAGWAAHRAMVDQHLPFRDFEFARRAPDGLIRYFSVGGEPRFAPDGAFVGYRGVGRDITEIALARQRIASLAYSDPLTGLANRTSLVPSLEQAVQRSRRRNSRLAVVFMDLDGFKQINDFLGHDSGDALLIELAGRLRAHLRASDLVARLGGDEFLVVLEEVPDSSAIGTIARKLLGEVAKPYVIAGATARVTASIGISVFPDDAADAAALMKHADTAMYTAKQKGKNTYCFYSAVPANDPAEGSLEKKA